MYSIESRRLQQILLLVHAKIVAYLYRTFTLAYLRSLVFGIKMTGTNMWVGLIGATVGVPESAESIT